MFGKVDTTETYQDDSLGPFPRDAGHPTGLASVAHPQSNGQVKQANGLILSGIKPRLVEPQERSAGY